MELTEFPEVAQLAITEARDRLIKTFNPEYILLGGSFAKGDWIEESDGDLLSDFEIVFINKKRWSRKKAKRIAYKLKQKYKLDFSVSGYSKKRVLKKQPGNLCFGSPGYITLTYFDTINEHNVIYKKNNPHFELPVTSIEEVPLWESWKLFVNRFGDFIKSKYIDNNKNIDYYWLKLFQAAADTLLLSKKKYIHDINERYRRLEICRSNNNSLPDEEYIETLLMALKGRKAHNISIFSNFIRPIEETKLLAILEYWFSRIENMMFQEENINIGDYSSYLKHNYLQNKYSNIYIAPNLSVSYSNILSFLLNRKSIGQLRYKSIFKSWQHVSLVAIVCLFKELNSLSLDLPETRELLQNIYKRGFIDSLSNEGVIELTVTTWERFR